VLGNYILVMSHAVSAAFGDSICIPVAGIIACLLMFGLTQLRTMALLGRTTSLLSLLALFAVVVQCLYAANMVIPVNTTPSAAANGTDFNSAVSNRSDTTAGVASFETGDDDDASFLRQLSAMGSIAFAVGSQKLFLNIRHELRDKSKAPIAIGSSLGFFGTFYVAVIALAGTNPPSFLLDAIPPDTWNRSVAGLLLFFHVAVSYAINSQALCSSLDRLFWHRYNFTGAMVSTEAGRWVTLTGTVVFAAYTVANAIPFFKDLVALIGAFTSVPLTLLFPAVLWRKSIGVPLWTPTADSLWSYALTVFSVAFMAAATIGSISSIEVDWSRQGGPFACH